MRKLLLYAQNNLFIFCTLSSIFSGSNNFRVFALTEFELSLTRLARGPIHEAIESGAADYNKEDCTWRRGDDKDACPDPDVHVYLYTPGKEKKRKLMEEFKGDWLQMDYQPTLENVILVHGYAGGDDTLPMSVLRDAYLKNGSYNVFLVDWGALSAAPCYPAAIANLRPVARCLAQTLTTLRKMGLPILRTTCVGHSLGAHLCGMMANFLFFRMHKIIGLDPARPLVRPGLVNRLDSGDADFVEVIHTNAGYYGEIGRVGHVDFCVNGGRVQPFCQKSSNEQLCSHVWVVCYMAESIFGDSKSLTAEPCSRRCPAGPRINSRPGERLIMGQHTPVGSRGSFCLKRTNPPFCPDFSSNGIGDQRCCLEKIPSDRVETDFVR
ncbi:phospholipase A1 member A [Diachasma alloeum]|uniref:phospholipase A1 member A n=1 Tax=Diachasma alloeum TaxID=454923 RepID=UPI0007383A3F|nr:phospholipase A1 member A [Diachasma alloeum]